MVKFTEQTTSLSTRPVASVVREYEANVTMKTQKMQEQQVGDGSKGNAQQGPSIEELREHVAQLKTLQEKLLYVCSNGSDAVSVELLGELILNEKSVKLDKVLDKKNSGMGMLHILAQKNKPQCIEFLLLQQKINIDIQDNVHATPLLHASANNSLESVAILLSKGAKVNSRDTWGKFPLQVAMKNKHYGVAELLASHTGADVHLRATKGNTVLHHCAADGDLTGVKLLIEKCGASAQRRNNDEDNVLQLALAYPAIVHYLCEKTEDKKLLYKMAMNVNIEGRTAIHECAFSGHFDSMLLILKSIDMSELSMSQIEDLLNGTDNSGNTPLILATKQANVSIVRLLCQCLEVKKNIGDEEGNTALFHAAAMKNTDMVNMITSVGGSFKADSDEEKVSSNWVLDCTRSLRTLLVLLLLAVAFFCIITIASISIGFFASTVAKSTSTIRVKYFEEIVTHLKSTITETTKIHRMSFTDPNFNVTNEDHVLDTTAQILFRAYELLPLVNLVYCSKSNGYFAGWIKNSNNPSVAYWSSNYKNESVTTFVIVSNLKNYRVWNPYTTLTQPTRDPGEKMYTKLAKSTNGTIWTTSYTSLNQYGEIYMTLSRGFRDPVTNEFLGSCQFDFLTKGLSTFLNNNANQEPNSVTIIVEAQTGLLIGTSDLEVKVINQTAAGAVRFTDSLGVNKRMDATLDYARGHFGGLNLTTVPSDKNIYDTFKFEGKKQVLNIGTITDEYGLHWIVLQSMPMRNFYSRFYNSIIVMICATIALLLLSVIISIVIATLFMRPINTLIHQAHYIELLQLEQVEKSLRSNVSYFSEVNSLQKAFGAMTARLKQFRNFIPDHILSVIEAEIGEKSESSEHTRSGEPKEKNSLSNTPSKDETMTDSTHVFVNKGGLKNIVNQALSSGLTGGTVSLMVVKFPDFAKVLHVHSAKEIDQTSKELLSEFMDIIRISRGQFVGISSSKAVVAWNTFIKQNDHRARACNTAIKCVTQLKKLHAQWKANNLPLLEVNIAITSGNVFFGNMGTDRMKFFTVIGTTADRASAMLKENAKWDVQVVCDSNVHEHTSEDFEMRPLYTLTTDESEKSSQIYQLGDSKPADGWADMNSDEGHRWREYNSAYELFQKGHYEEAYDKFLQYLSNNMQDVPAQNMLAQCKAQKEDSSLLTPTETTSAMAE